MLDLGVIVDAKCVGDEFRSAARMGETLERRIMGARRTMAAMVLGIDVQSAIRHLAGKTGVAACMFGEAVLDQQNTARRRFGTSGVDVEQGARRAVEAEIFVEQADTSLLGRAGMGASLNGLEAIDSTLFSWISCVESRVFASAGAKGCRNAAAGFTLSSCWPWAMISLAVMGASGGYRHAPTGSHHLSRGFL